MLQLTRCAYGMFDDATGDVVRCEDLTVPGQMYCLYHLKNDLDENGEPYDEE